MSEPGGPRSPPEELELVDHRADLEEVAARSALSLERQERPAIIPRQATEDVDQEEPHAPADPHGVHPIADDPDVQFLVGMAYLQGDGVPADKVAAESWIRRAAAGGNADAAAALAPRPAQPAVDDFSRFVRGQGAQRTQSGVFVIGAETGNRPALYLVDPAVRQVVAASGATPLMAPDDIRIAPGVVPPAAEIAQRVAGRGWLLYLELELKWGAIGFAKDRITVTCYDPLGAEQWSEEAANTFANSRDHSTQILIDKITKKLGKRAGQACLRP